MKSVRGYSLLELLVVIAIMALIALVAVPAVGASVTRMTLQSDVRTVMLGLRALRADAMDRQADIVVVVSGRDPNVLGASNGESIVLASGTAATLAPAQLVVTWDGRIAGRVQLTRGDGSAQIVADRLTGRLRAETVR
jgi:prepilin-type N-terminal cleavage/methylation domain-containing protein